MEDNLLVYVNRGVEPDLLLFFELDLFFIDSDAIRSCRELLIAVLRIVPVPVVHRLPSAINAEPFQNIGTLRERSCTCMESARQPDQSGWRARLLHEWHLLIISHFDIKFVEHPC